MTELTPKDMADKLLAAPFQRGGPEAEALSDPIADTPMTVTLDQLQPYDLNPRVTRNPRYDDIKDSIRERGLDSPPAITRRPGEPHYIIRNGGNTRLAILRELWTETKDERFFRIPCLFRPWPERGEIVALTGHLAENELHGGLTFIERALGVEKARELYEVESGEVLSQTELARRLTADGYPIPQPHISRMQDAVTYLLPAIPTVLYGGLGRPQIERLSTLRKSSETVWDTRSEGKSLNIDFPSLFHDVLASFDHTADGFSVGRVQDELIGQMAELLEVDYDTLTLDITEPESRRRIMTRAPVPHAPAPVETLPPPINTESAHPTSPPSVDTPRISVPLSEPPQAEKIPCQEPTPSPNAPEDSDPVSMDRNERIQGNIVTPATTTDRLKEIHRLMADTTGEAWEDFESNVLKAIPVQAGGLYPITDVWYIEPRLDTPDSLRVHIAQFASEIADEAGQAEHIQPVDTGIGFLCDMSALATDGHAVPMIGRAVLTLLHALSTGYQSASQSLDELDNLRLLDHLGPLLQGRQGGNSQVSRLSDNALVKLYRLLRLSRRLVDLESDTGANNTAPGAS